MEDKNKILEIFYRIKGRGSKNTLEQYQRNLDTFFNFLDKNYEVDYLNIKAYMLIDFEDYINKNKFQDKRYKTEHLIELSTETKYSLLKSVSGLYSWLYENDYITKDLAKGIDLKKYKSKEKKNIYLKQDEYTLLIDYLKSDYVFPNKRGEDLLKPRDLAIYSTMLKHGNRVYELMSLTFDDIQGDKIHIKAENRKNKCELTNRIDTQLGEILNDYLSVRKSKNINSDLVFTSKNGNQLTRSNINGALKKRIHEANKWAEIIGDSRRIDENKPISSHKLRHTCATSLNANNNSIQTIASILGQKTISIARDIYTHVDNMSVELNQL